MSDIEQLKALVCDADIIMAELIALREEVLPPELARKIIRWSNMALLQQCLRQR